MTGAAGQTVTAAAVFHHRGVRAMHLDLVSLVEASMRLGPAAALGFLVGLEREFAGQCSTAQPREA